MNHHTTPPPERFDAFLDQPIINPWNQSLRIQGETIKIEQSPTGSAFVNYSGERPVILALMAVLCSLYRGSMVDTGRWYFHAQLQPSLRIAMLALQDKAGYQIAEDILRTLDTHAISLSTGNT